MSNVVTPTVYVKTGCPWCEEVIDYLGQRNLPHHRVVVSGNPASYAAMVALSGQGRAPTMDWDGEVLADFGVDELVEFLAAKGLA